jgi:hypothetical protein
MSTGTPGACGQGLPARVRDVIVTVEQRAIEQAMEEGLGQTRIRGQPAAVGANGLEHLEWRRRIARGQIADLVFSSSSGR